jgi:hypothetical protein
VTCPSMRIERDFFSNIAASPPKNTSHICMTSPDYSSIIIKVSRKEVQPYFIH